MSEQCYQPLFQPEFECCTLQMLVKISFSHFLHIFLQDFDAKMMRIWIHFCLIPKYWSTQNWWSSTLQKYHILLAIMCFDQLTQTQYINLFFLSRFTQSLWDHTHTLPFQVTQTHFYTFQHTHIFFPYTTGYSSSSHPLWCIFLLYLICSFVLSSFYFLFTLVQFVRVLRNILGCIWNSISFLNRSSHNRPEVVSWA